MPFWPAVSVGKKSAGFFFLLHIQGSLLCDSFSPLAAFKYDVNVSILDVALEVP